MQSKYRSDFHLSIHPISILLEVIGSITRLVNTNSKVNPETHSKKEDLENSVVTIRENIPVLLKHIADIEISAATKIGKASFDGMREEGKSLTEAVTED